MIKFKFDELLLQKAKNNFHARLKSGRDREKDILSFILKYINLQGFFARSYEGFE